jgi:voltage-gated potassium channel
MDTSEKGPRFDLGYEIFIAAASILSIANMVLIYLPGVNLSAVEVLLTVNSFLTLLFVFDFGIRLYRAPSRSWYFFRDYGWADLFAVMPFFRVLRLFRVMKAYRLVKRHGLRNLHAYLVTHKADSALYTIVFSAILIIQMGSYLVLIAESGSPEATITSASDAMWWSYVTITTVGYGDMYPVTFYGRMVGIMVMTVGVAVFATFAGYVSNKLLFAKPHKKGREVPGETASDPLEELKYFLAEREKIDAEIRIRLERLEEQSASRQSAG